MKVVFSLEVENYFFELIEILHEKEYFGFKESATKYVRELIKDIQSELETSPKKLAPPYFDKYGRNLYYSSFRRNKSTQWFVFFSTYSNNGENIYLVEYIANNHSIAHLI
jgi:hypothetical protein